MELTKVQAQLFERDQSIKLLQFKLKEMTKGAGALSLTEKQFLDVQQMVNMTGPSKLPLQLQKQREAGERYNYRNMARSIAQSHQSAEGSQRENFKDTISVATSGTAKNREELPAIFRKRNLSQVETADNHRRENSLSRNAIVADPSFTSRKKSIQRGLRDLQSVSSQKNYATLSPKTNSNSKRKSVPYDKAATDEV